MNKNIRTEIIVNNQKIGVMFIDGKEYISLTDLARYQNPCDPSFVVKNWLRKITPLNFLGLWEKINNEFFNLVEFDQIKIESGKNSFSISPSQWVNRTGAIGIISKRGKYSIGTYAHSDIALEFASWLSPEFKLYVIQEFQRLKKSEAYNNKIDWHVNRLLSKANYLVHTDAIKNYIVPNVTDKQIRYVYASEADLLNVALFGMTAKEWRDANPDIIDGNIRDYTDLLHLIILSNLENINAELIRMNLSQGERLVRLNNIARNQMDILIKNNSISNLEYYDK